MISKFDSAFSYMLIYVFAIFDEKHKGCLKIGKSTIKLEDDSQYASLLNANSSLLNKSAKGRIDSYTKTAGITYSLLHTELAERKVRRGATIHLEYFEDHLVHNVLKNSGIKNVPLEGSKEWFKTDLDTVKNAIKAVKEGRDSLTGAEISLDHIPIAFRPEQIEAIEMTTERFKKHNKMLWNAKMRFGKTLSALEVIKRQNFKKTIILTHRPVVDASWSEDFIKIFWGTGYYYCSRGTQESNIEKHIKRNESFLFFASIQNLRGSEAVGGNFDKNNAIFKTNWDLVIVDEAHEGTRTSLGDDVLKEIIKENTYGKTKQIYLSGTPFNLVKDFEEEEVFTWDYVMEQKAKADWDIIHALDSNPYEGLPKLSIFTYDIANAIPNYEDIEEKAFNFREFFRVWTGLVENDGQKIPENSQSGRFVHEKDVISLLNMLCRKDDDSNYPFSREEYRDYFSHTLWMLPGVKEAKALQNLLIDHKIFGLFNIVNVAGSNTEEIPDALERLEYAITDNPEQTRTITLSCGRLTTGVTVKPWTAVLMLSGTNATSASAYLQTIFRVQTPANINGKIKDRCFVFDFAPDRTLQMVAEAGKLGIRPGSNDSTSEAKMKEFLNYCPVIAIQGSEMRNYDVDSMLRQLKRYYAARVAQNGFDDIKLYNDNLLKLTDLDREKFEELKKIVGATKAIDIQRKIIISESGLGPEEQQAAEEAEKKKRQKKELTEEEKEALKKLKEAKEAKSKAISILRAISIRIPLLVYGAEKDLDEDITIENFAELVDDESWKEFMPVGVTKEKFNEFIIYYDKDIFIEAGNQIRRKVKAADDLNPTGRVRKLAEIFGTFKNPDKETVLTPWRVVNMHMGDCLGGYVFYDEKYTELIEEPRFVDRGEVTTKTIANTEAKILEINSKSGLYPLYVAYSIYRKRIDSFNDEDKTSELQDKLWRQTLNKNVFVICKTEMAKLITKRTLLGYKDGKINAHYFEDLVNQFKNKSARVIKKITTRGIWYKGEIGNMKFDAIVGNPPYMFMDGGYGVSATPIYQHFVNCSKQMAPSYLSMIMPSKWFTGGKYLDEFRADMLKDKHISKLIDYSNFRDVFPGVDLAGGVCYFLWDKFYDGECSVRNASEIHSEPVMRNLGEFDVFIRTNKALDIVHKALTDNRDASVLSDIVSARKPFGLPTNYEPKDFGIPCWFIQKYGKRFANPADVTDTKNYLNKWKFLIPIAPIAGQTDFSKPVGFFYDGNTVVAKPGECCTESYIIAGAFETKSEVLAFKSYILTKTVRFLLLQTVVSQHVSQKNFYFVPNLGYYEGNYSDSQLCKEWGITDEEWHYIDSRIHNYEGRVVK